MPLNVCHNVSSYVMLGTKYVSESVIAALRIGGVCFLGVLNMSVCLIQSLTNCLAYVEGGYLAMIPRGFQCGQPAPMAGKSPPPSHEPPEYKATTNHVSLHLWH